MKNRCAVLAVILLETLSGCNGRMVETSRSDYLKEVPDNNMDVNKESYGLNTREYSFDNNDCFEIGNNAIRYTVVDGRNYLFLNAYEVKNPLRYLKDEYYIGDISIEVHSGERPKDNMSSNLPAGTKLYRIDDNYIMAYCYDYYYFMVDECFAEKNREKAWQPEWNK